MKSLKIYEDYTRIMLELSALQSQYSSLDAAAGTSRRADIQEKINSCRTKLMSVTNTLINSNPFQKGRSIKGALVKEESQ